LKEVFILSKKITTYEQKMGWDGLSFHVLNETTFSVGTNIINMVDVKEMVDTLEHFVIDQMSHCFGSLPGIDQLLKGNARLHLIDDNKNTDASFTLKWAGTDRVVNHASSKDLGSELTAKLKTLKKKEATKWLDHYCLLNKYLEVVILLGSQIRATQLRAMPLRSAYSAQRSVKFFPSLLFPDKVCCKTICFTQKIKFGPGELSGEWA